MAAAATRDIVFVLKANADPAARKVFDEWAKLAKGAQQEIDAAVAKSGTKRVKTEELYNGQTLAFWAKESRIIDNHLKAREQAAIKTANTIKEANARMSAGFDKAAEGALKMGRALALSGLVGEENLQKVTDALIKIQATSDAIRGAKDLFQGVGMLSAGGKAATAAGGGGLAAGAAGLAGPALAAAAALGSLALAAKVASEAMNGTANRAGSVSDSIGLWETGIIGWIDSLPGVAKIADAVAPFTTQFSQEVLKASRGARDSAIALDEHAKATAKASADREAIDRASARDIQAGAAARAGQMRAGELQGQFDRNSRGLTGTAADRFDNALARASAAKELRDAEAAIADAKRAGLRSEQTAAEIQRNALERAIGLENERLDIVRRERAERVSGLKEALAAQDQLASKAMAHAKELHNSTRSDQQRFADLDIEQKMQLVQARNKLNRGQDLTRDEAGLAGQFNEFRDQAGVNRANQGARQDVFGLFRDGQQRAARAAETAGREQAKRIDINNRLEVTVNNTSDEKAVIDALMPMIQQLIRSQAETVERAKRVAAQEAGQQVANQRFKMGAT